MHSFCWYSVAMQHIEPFIRVRVRESFVFRLRQKNSFYLRFVFSILIIILFHFICRFAELSILQTNKHGKVVFLSLADSGSKPTEFFDGYARFKIFDHLLTQNILFIGIGAVRFSRGSCTRIKVLSHLLHANLIINRNRTQ